MQHGRYSHAQKSNHNTHRSARRVQLVTDTNNGGSATLSGSWGSATSLGNLLVAVLAFRGGTGTTVTVPSGQSWQLATLMLALVFLRRK